LNKNLLITGGAGFLGRRLSFALAAAGHSVTAVVRNKQQIDDLQEVSGVAFRTADLADNEDTATLFQEGGYDAVIHTAAQLGPMGEAGFLPLAVQNNVLATAVLATAAAQAGSNLFIYCSSISVYEGEPRGEDGFHEDDPVAPAQVYGWSKLVGEQTAAAACRTGSMKGLALRLAGLHGRGRRGGVVSSMMTAATQGKSIRVSEPHTQLRLAFVDDVTAVVTAALDKSVERPWTTLNVAGKDSYSLLELAELVIAVCRSTSRIDAIADAPARRQFMDTANLHRQLDPALRSLREHLEELKPENEC
jgi:UDP-glucose 4-epimerase